MSERPYQVNDQGWMIFKSNPGPYAQRLIESFTEEGLLPTPVAPHTDEIKYLLSRFGGFFKSALKIYIPAHLIILLLRLRSKKEKKSTVLKKFVIGVLRSSLFVAVFASSIPCGRIVPQLKAIFNNKLGSWSGFLVSFLFSLSFLIESSSRWSDMSLYVFGQWMEGYTFSLIKRGYISRVKHFEKIILGLGIGLIMYLRYQKTDKPDSHAKANKMSTAIDYILGDLAFEETDNKSKNIKTLDISKGN